MYIYCIYTLYLCLTKTNYVQIQTGMYMIGRTSLIPPLGLYNFGTREFQCSVFPMRESFPYYKNSLLNCVYSVDDLNHNLIHFSTTKVLK